MIFGDFLCLKTLFHDVHQEKVSCNADNEMTYCRKPPVLTQPTVFYSKNLEMIENPCFMYVDINNKSFGQKVLVCLMDRLQTPLNTKKKLFFGNFFIIFFSTYMKNVHCIILRYFYLHFYGFVNKGNYIQ